MPKILWISPVRQACVACGAEAMLDLMTSGTGDLTLCCQPPASRCRGNECRSRSPRHRGQRTCGKLTDPSTPYLVAMPISVTCRPGCSLRSLASGYTSARLGMVHADGGTETLLSGFSGYPPLLINMRNIFVTDLLWRLSNKGVEFLYLF